MQWVAVDILAKIRKVICLIKKMSHYDSKFVVLTQNENLEDLLCQCSGYFGQHP